MQELAASERELESTEVGKDGNKSQVTQTNHVAEGLRQLVNAATVRRFFYSEWSCLKPAMAGSSRDMAARAWRIVAAIRFAGFSIAHCSSLCSSDKPSKALCMSFISKLA